MKSNIIEFFPSEISIIRIILAPIFFWTLINNFIPLSLIIIMVAVFTDVMDGYVARKLRLQSVNGAYIDVTADFIFICAGFMALIIRGIYPLLLLILIIFMFLQFIVTSIGRITIYDPVGKYYGSLLFFILFLSTLTTNSLLNLILITVITSFSVISMTSRVYYFIKG